MGLYDSIFLKIKCPYCEQESKMECQTKDLGRNLFSYKECDYVGDLGNYIKAKELNYLDCISECFSEECLNYCRNESYRFFYLLIYLDNGTITGKYRIISVQKKIKEGFRVKIKHVKI